VTLTLGAVALGSWVLAVGLAYILPSGSRSVTRPTRATLGLSFMMLMLLSGVMGPVVLVTAMVAVMSGGVAGARGKALDCPTRGGSCRCALRLGTVSCPIHGSEQRLRLRHASAIRRTPVMQPRRAGFHKASGLTSA